MNWHLLHLFPISDALVLFGRSMLLIPCDWVVVVTGFVYHSDKWTSTNIPSMVW